MAEHMTLSAIAQEANEIAKAHGFWDADRNVGEMLALIHSEISEALEEVREGPCSRPGAIAMIYYRPEKPAKPEGFGIELADVIIRIADLAYVYGIDLADYVRIKMDYNRTRPHKHGKHF